MSLIDAQNLFSDAQAITVTALSANIIDILTWPGAIGAGATGGPSANLTKDLGAGAPLYLHALVTTVFASGTSLTVSLESDSTSNLATSATVHLTAASAVPVATLVAGYWLAKGIPLPSGLYERYVGLRYTASGTFTTGNITAWLSNARHDTTQYYGGYKTGVN